MVIYFHNKKTSLLFSTEKELQRTFGKQQAQCIMECMKILEAVENLSQLKVFQFLRPHELKGRDKDKISLDIKHPYRLLIEPYHETEIPRLQDDGLDWDNIDKIIIVGVKDTHDGKIIR